MGSDGQRLRPAKATGIIVRRGRFFLALFLLIGLYFVMPRLLWLARSQRTWGVYAFAGNGNAGDQISLDYSVDYFRHGRDTIFFNGFGNLDYCPGDSIPIRYQTSDPSNAKVDLFVAIWGETAVNGGIPLVMLLCIYIHPGVVPRRACLRLAFKKPFVFIVEPIQIHQYDVFPGIIKRYAQDDRPEIACG
jgi:hypothetical protein